MLHRRMVVLLAVAGLGLVVPPATSAASAAPVASVTHQVGGVGASAPTGGITPAIQFRECSSQTTTWVDLDMLTASGIQDWCFGYTGTWYFYAPNNHMTFLCSGNNYGHYYYTRNGVMQPVHDFGPGYNATFADNERLKSLTITGWQGTYRCRS